MVLRWGFTVVVYKIKKSYDGKGTWDSSIEEEIRRKAGERAKQEGEGGGKGGRRGEG